MVWCGDILLVRCYTVLGGLSVPLLQSITQGVPSFARGPMGKWHLATHGRSGGLEMAGFWLLSLLGPPTGSPLVSGARKAQ